MLKKNILLCALALALAVGLTACFLTPEQKSGIVPTIIEKQLENKEIVLLDVREDSEWNAGHIKGAKHIALGNINIETTKDISKDMPVYTYCRSGKRAGKAEIKLKELGFSKAQKLGGIIEWQENGGTLVVN